MSNKKGVAVSYLIKLILAAVLLVLLAYGIYIITKQVNSAPSIMSYR